MLADDRQLCERVGRLAFTRVQPFDLTIHRSVQVEQCFQSRPLGDGRKARLRVRITRRPMVDQTRRTAEHECQVFRHQSFRVHAGADDPADAAGRLHVLAPFPVDEHGRVRPVRHAGGVHPVDLVADLEPRILHRTGEPMVRAAGGEHGRMAAGLQHAQHLTPQSDVERDARRIPIPPHEPKLIRRIRDHRIHAAVRQRGQQFTAIPLIQADALAKRNHIHAYASRHCQAQATIAPSEHAAITAVDTRCMRPGNGMTHTTSVNRAHTSIEQPATTSRHRRRNRFASTRSCSCLLIYPCVRHARTRIDHHRTRSP